MSNQNDFANAHEQIKLWQAQARAERVVVAFSGGLDSTVLLHWLATQVAPNRRRGRQVQLARFEVVYVDHGLHADSKRWGDQCRAFAAELGLPITILPVQVRAQGQGLEAAARRARYQAIAQHFGVNTLLLTAHHQSDQAETVLMKILSGAGTRGAGGMLALSERAEFLLGRPFLTVAKTALLDYAQRHQLRWIEDPSNESSAFRRNQLRALMPQLRAIFPDASVALSAFAEQAQQDRVLLEMQAKLALARCLGLDAKVLLLTPLWQEASSLQAWVVRAWLADLGVHHAALWRSALGLLAKEIAYSEVRVASVSKSILYVRRFRDALYFSDLPETDLLLSGTLSWQASAPLRLPGALGTLCFENTSAPVNTSLWWVRQRLGGERIQLPGRVHSHALKDILQQANIPPWQRKHLILLFFSDTGELAWVSGVCASARFSDWLEAQQTRLMLKKAK
jgi:tRNA(Ile)-lysidine synthase